MSTTNQIVRTDVSSTATETTVADETSPAGNELYNRNFFLAAASQTCFVVANTLMAHYARWIEFLDGTVRDVGWVMSFGAIFGVFFRPWIGQWINRFGAKRMWMGGFCFFAIGAVGNLVTYDIGPLIFILRSIVVLGASIVFASGLTYISHVAPSHRQAEAIGIVGIGGFVGMLIGPVAGDVLLGVGERQRADFTMLFVVAALGNLLTIILVSRLKTPMRATHSSQLSARAFVKSVIRNWPGTILLVDLVFGLCMAIPFGFLASYIDEVPLVIPGVSIMGFYFWCYAGCGIFLRIVGRRLPENFGRRRVLLAGCAMMAAGLASFAFVTAEAPALIGIPATLSGLAHGLMFHTMTSLTLSKFPAEEHGTGSSLALMMLDVGTICGAPLLAMLVDWFNFENMFLIAAGIVAAVGIVYWIAPGSEEA
ncbi:MAG TPA: hypothetical protein DDW52_27270 [Planctomycetaceae bacterium]|nr:hypothetical protein [Planctomycetaceae bacterium]